MPRETHSATPNTIRIKGRQFEYIHDFRPKPKRVPLTLPRYAALHPEAL